MLPTTNPVAEVRPKVCAFFSLRADMVFGPRAESRGSARRPKSGGPVEPEGRGDSTISHLRHLYSEFPMLTSLNSSYSQELCPYNRIDVTEA